MFSLIPKEILLIEETAENVSIFFKYFKIHNLEDKLFHAWGAEEANSIIEKEDITNLKLIIIRLTSFPGPQINLLRTIRNRSDTKIIPIAVIVTTITDYQIVELSDIFVNALIFTPLDKIKFKRIIALGNYT